ncbi:hypothetical protein E4Z66_09430 [Aliishimia ponticola]|uniref:Uncharacterized protein n=1 Tax=Aliishimia ponticola TaxID=2499833 RepID=A0A4S4NCI9_9RHOB|nr:hypothetical protein [Aliishimia ponticola]THH37142.1 hypothetical protein E4Z66_09430 [Aliishimia ponticola]
MIRWYDVQAAASSPEAKGRAAAVFQHIAPMVNWAAAPFHTGRTTRRHEAPAAVHLRHPKQFRDFKGGISRDQKGKAPFPKGGCHFEMISRNLRQHKKALIKCRLVPNPALVGTILFN